MTDKRVYMHGNTLCVRLCVGPCAFCPPFKKTESLFNTPPHTLLKQEDIEWKPTKWKEGLYVPLCQLLPFKVREFDLWQLQFSFTHFYLLSSGLGTIRIPHDRNWSKLECDNLRNYASECPYDQLIDMETTLEQGLQIVNDNIDNIFSTPPLVIARLYRGGKTTVLKALFQRLKDRGFFPIIITLNEVVEKRYPTEPPLEQLIRLIAVQLVEVAPNEIMNTFVCNEQDLVSRLYHLSQVENKKIVLLIDTLNKFGAPDVDDAVSNFLIANFLDKQGRYLIVSSHIMIRLQHRVVAAQHYLESTNVSTVRGINTILLPFCSDKSILRGMGEKYKEVTNLDVLLGAGIPSLIYAKNQPTEMSMVATFRSVMEVMIMNKYEYLTVNPRQALIKNFLSELFEGENQQLLFTPFADIFIDKGKEFVRYPLPYIWCIWEWLGVGLDGVLQELLKTHSARDVEGDNDWEIILITALVLGFLRCQYFPVDDIDGSLNRGPFDIATEGVKYLRIINIPSEVYSISDAINYLYSYLHAKPMIPKTIIIAIPKYNKFPDLNGFILYLGSTSPLTIYGYQAKPTRGTPRHNIPDEITKCFLLRGNAPKHDDHLGKWDFKVQSEMKALLGFSLAPFYPKDWGKEVDKAQDNFD